ncbi:MAG: DEAD/DEAH box helicase [Planctomycetes bacterium]|nr:DEAD/DEAH box helicase [Planctomycetota bacterium]
MTFEELQLLPPLVQAVTALGYTQPTPIQEKAIPHALAGRDVLGCAQTGTGKTAAFALPILQQMLSKPMLTPEGKPITAGAYRPIRALVLSPTRELAAQIDESFRDYGKFAGLRHSVIFGGVNQNPQTEKLNKGVDILTATPGRLLDLMNQGFVNLGKVEFLVLDEADRMLDMGFLPDIRRIIAKVPKQRQTLFFSATMPGEIRHLADSILSNPIAVEAAPPATTAERVKQAVYFVSRGDKPILLAHLLTKAAYSRVLVFVRTKHGADRLVRQLRRWGINAVAIHGDKTQGARTRALDDFKKLKVQILIATDIAARGLDIDDVSHVINFDIPNEPENYVHRIGRTARAGASGEAISFVGEADEHPSWLAIEKLTRQRIPILKADDPEYLERRRDPGRGATPLPEEPDDASLNQTIWRTERGQRRGGPRRHEHRERREHREHGGHGGQHRGGQGGHRGPSTGSGQGGHHYGGSQQRGAPRPEKMPAPPHERDDAYENANMDLFKPNRPPQPKKQQPHPHHVQGHHRRSQG